MAECIPGFQLQLNLDKKTVPLDEALFFLYYINILKFGGY